VFTQVRGRRIELERLQPRQPSASPHTLVLLHEGLGSVAMWRDFPQRLADATGLPALVYSRYGYGQSEALHEPRDPRYMHGEAHEVLPELLDQQGIGSPILVGHSDGGSIALIYAGETGRTVAGIIALAPHVMVEQITVDSIAASREAYLKGDLARRLARYHADPDSTFWGWNDIWLKPAFRDWNIEDCLPRIACPILAIQGLQDAYGTMEQLRIIERRAPRVTLLELADCGHAPHRDQPEAVLGACKPFVATLSGSN